jgi:hypothetical protein
MLPDNLYKRRPKHNNTPDSIMLVITNYAVVVISTGLLNTKDHISAFFWVVIALLAYYNFYMIRRNREEFAERITLIAYIVNLFILVGLFFLLRNGI